MKRANMPPDIGGDPAAFPSQRGSKRSRSRQSTIEPIRRRSNTASRGSQHARSRGSTASIQSCTTQYIPDQHQGPDGYEPFPRPQFGASQHAYNENPEDMIIRFGDQLANSHSGALLDPALQENHNSTRPRSELDFSGHGYHNHENLAHGLQQDLAPHGIPGDPHPNHYQALFDGMENQIADQMMEENDGASEAGPRKRKGTTSSIANDKELRRLLRQYDGFNLQQMAGEVQKHEGAGGKSEKVKQVFAMIWLRENCRKCSGSVRRDRVYCCYAEKCGTERVSVLNPASFGKLVRIIFPNVQTRRLGVRGESKYHYVDLTIVDQGPKPEQDARERDGIENNNVITGEKKSTPALHEKSSDSFEQHSQPKPTDFSQPTTSRVSTCQDASSYSPDCECKPSDRPNPRPLSGFEARNMKAQQRLRRILYLGPDSNAPAVQNASLRLPDIHEHLPANSDSDVADALAALYRSHCISVIDSFRFCREKTLFRHFSAFQGTLTVPVQKLMVHPDIAPWIEECDWLMYQKMVAFVAPLSTQVIPGQVLKAFRSISEGLVNHISETFKPQPEHVSTARLVPAQLFCHLLTRMLDANQSANAAAAWICSTENRTQMWEDFKTFVNPIDVISKAQIPLCAVAESMNILRERLKLLLLPLFNQPPGQSQSYDQGVGLNRFGDSSTASEEYTEFPDRWISFIYQLPLLFPGHHAGCIVEKVDSLWTIVLHRLTLGGCQSFSAWWMTKVFFLEMIHWHTELGGFMQATPRSLRLVSTDPKADTSKQEVANATSSTQNPTSGTPSQEQQSKPADVLMDISPPATEGNQNVLGGTSSQSNSQQETKQIATGKDPDTTMNDSPSNNDDSAIDLEDDSVLLTTGKYVDMTASDPADAEGDVVVV